MAALRPVGLAMLLLVAACASGWPRDLARSDAGRQRLIAECRAEALRGTPRTEPGFAARLTDYAGAVGPADRYGFIVVRLQPPPTSPGATAVACTFSRAGSVSVVLRQKVAATQALPP